MTAETIIQKVREELGTLDKNGEQTVAAVLKVLKRTEPGTLESTKETFVSRNITLEEYIGLPRLERRRYQSEARNHNALWIENQFNRLAAKWIMVVDGRVVQHGATLDNYPEDEEFLEFCQKTGKYPFVFFNKRVFAIEESPTAWHKTRDNNDYYPAATIVLSNTSNQFITEADLDTGAIDCYSDLELLLTNGIITVRAQDFEDTSEHLGQSFIYLAKRAWLELADESGRSRRWRTTIICVSDWQNSPFTAINPTRTFLLGRSVLLELRPRVVLDFEAHSTQVYYSVKAS